MYAEKTEDQLSFVVNAPWNKPWADPVAARALTPLILHEGWEAIDFMSNTMSVFVKLRPKGARTTLQARLHRYVV
jgi:hypothetical protein